MLEFTCKEFCMSEKEKMLAQKEQEILEALKLEPDYN